MRIAGGAGVMRWGIRLVRCFHDPAKPNFSKQPLLEKLSKARVLLDTIRQDSLRSPGGKLLIDGELGATGTSKRSIYSRPGLLGGTRYGFRVAGTAGGVQGPWSDPVTKIAP